jgi:hypothetical protein
MHVLPTRIYERGTVRFSTTVLLGRDRPRPSDARRTLFIHRADRQPTVGLSQSKDRPVEITLPIPQQNDQGPKMMALFVPSETLRSHREAGNVHISTATAQAGIPDLVRVGHHILADLLSLRSRRGKHLALPTTTTTVKVPRRLAPNQCPSPRRERRRRVTRVTKHFRSDHRRTPCPPPRRTVRSDSGLRAVPNPAAKHTGPRCREKTYLVVSTSSRGSLQTGRRPRRPRRKIIRPRWVLGAAAGFRESWICAVNLPPIRRRHKEVQILCASDSSPAWLRPSHGQPHPRLCSRERPPSLGYMTTFASVYLPVSKGRRRQRAPQG